MENDKPYTNPNLRITDLAAMVDCTPTKPVANVQPTSAAEFLRLRQSLPRGGVQTPCGEREIQSIYGRSHF